MDAISSVEELVCSNEAACSVAPSANDWLAEETWFAAVDTSSAPEAMRAAKARRELLALRTIRSTARPAQTPRINRTEVIRMLLTDLLWEASDVWARSRDCCSTRALACLPISSSRGNSFCVKI